MKRSEIKQTIEDIILMTCIVSEPSYNVHDVSESLLCAMEGKGMLPPCPTGELAVTYRMTYIDKFCTWEKEDEE